jgi:glycolate oxidase iron-sulfur subunit
MQTFLDRTFLETPEGREADRILRSCVHCGFCNATCPTYQLLGDERDGPRGRIYLIKQMLENGKATRETQLHLDRCLACRSCETTCPSGVEYHRLLEIGRAEVEKRVERPVSERMQRAGLLHTVPEPGRLRPLITLARAMKPVLPDTIAKAIPRERPKPEPWPSGGHQRAVLLLQGCVQSVTHPQISLATARVLDRLGFEAIPAGGCCGTLAQHMAAGEEAAETMRRNIDAWWPEIESGVEAVLLTATGCAPLVQDYGRQMEYDPVYADRAASLSARAMDISAFLERQDLSPLGRPGESCGPVAFHSPCSLQHGLKSPGRVEALLARLGFELTPVPDGHLCCGSAGTYSILQKDLSQQLLRNKVRALESGRPELIATANIGCLTHIQGGTGLVVKHWIELLG